MHTPTEQKRVLLKRLALIKDEIELGQYAQAQTHLHTVALELLKLRTDVENRTAKQATRSNTLKNTPARALRVI